jgi:hypothetical protein
VAGALALSGTTKGCYTDASFRQRTVSMQHRECGLACALRTLFRLVVFVDEPRVNAVYYAGVASLQDLGSNEVDRTVIDVVRTLFRSNAFWLRRQHDRLPLA